MVNTGNNICSNYDKYQPRRITIYIETIQATLIIQAQIKAEKGNIIYVPENPLQVVQQYIGTIIITIIIVLIVAIKKNYYE